MAKKKQDLKPDIVLKNYWSNNEQFSDLFNAILFNGKQRIKPEELEEIDTEESNILEHREYAEALKASRDMIKIQKKSTAYGVQLVLLGLENQEHIHYAMPMRVMGYDYGAYKKQYDSNAQKYINAKGLEPDEFLSKMKKTDKFIPVITVLLYYGEKPWDGAKSLHEMLEIPEEIQSCVNDYKILLAEARQNNLTLHNINNQDLFNLLEILLDDNTPPHKTKEKAIHYAEEHAVKKSVVMTAAGANNCKMDYNAFEKRGGADMCTVFEELRKEGIAKGIIETCIDLGFSEDDILERLRKKLDITLQKAQEYFQMFGKK